MINRIPNAMEDSPEGVVVEGAGNSAVDGFYMLDGEAAGRPRYTMGEYSILWVLDGHWTLLYGTAWLYSCKNWEDVPTPDLCTEWENWYGNAPAPGPTVRLP